MQRKGEGTAGGGDFIGKGECYRKKGKGVKEASAWEKGGKREWGRSKER